MMDAFLQLRTALDSTTEVTGGDSRTGVGAIFIQKEIDRMVRETINVSTDFRQLVPRKTMRQLAYIWNLKTSKGSTIKTTFYSDGGTGIPYPSQFLQLYAPAKAMRSDYEVTGLTIAAASSYFNAIASEARDAIEVHGVIEEQAMILGDDTSSETTGITLNAKIGVASAWKGLKQLLSSAVSIANGGLGDASAVYGSTRSATVANREYKLNVQTTKTSATTTTPLSVPNLDAIITLSNIQGGKHGNRMFLCSEKRMDKISALLAPQGRYIIGATSVELDGGQRVLSWQNYKIISSRFMAFLGITSSTGTGSANFVDTDNCVLFLDMNHINFYNVAGVDARHVPIMGADASQRSDVEGGYFKTYGIFVVDKFNTHGIIWNLTAL